MDSHGGRRHHPDGKEYITLYRGGTPLSHRHGRLFPFASKVVAREGSRIPSRESTLSMSKSFDQRNQSDTARRKLKNLAKAAGVDLELVSALANFTWDYDPNISNEATGWVNPSSGGKAAKQQLTWVAERLGLSPDFSLIRNQAEKELIQAYRGLSIDEFWSRFLIAATSGNYGHVSEFASYHYLRGIDKSRIGWLAWRGKEIGILEIARNLFLKLFRGGSIERGDLDYVWCDLTLKLPCEAKTQDPELTCLEPLLRAIEELPPRSGLKDLLAWCKGLVGGDKFFKQEVLQSLAYAGILAVDGFPVSELFIPELRNKLSPHFYSNEWSFPLRFWSTNGGTVNRKAMPRR